MEWQFVSITSDVQVCGKLLLGSLAELQAMFVFASIKDVFGLKPTFSKIKNFC
jgi:hypothetical protein